MSSIKDSLDDRLSHRIITDGSSLHELLEKIMGNAWTKKTLKEQLRENKRTLNRAIRELDRERTSLQNQEKKLIIDIKKMAKEGQTSSVRIMAKDLVRTRSYITKFYTMKSQLQAVSLRLEVAKSTEAMAGAMQGTTKAMKAMAKSMNLPKLNAMMQEFVRENEKMEAQQELMGDCMDDVMEGDQDEDEEEKIVSQVLDEIGIDLSGSVPEAPNAVAAAAAATTAPAPQKVAASATGPAASGGGNAAPGVPPAAPSGGSTDATVNELEARLNNLRRS